MRGGEPASRLGQGVARGMIAPEIRADAGPLLDELERLGYQVAAAEYSAESFGNWYIDMAGPKAFRMIKDRGQFLVDGEEDALRRAGLWRAFDDRAEFLRLIRDWAAG